MDYLLNVRQFVLDGFYFITLAGKDEEKEARDLPTAYTTVDPEPMPTIIGCSCVSTINSSTAKRAASRFALSMPDDMFAMICK